MAPETLNEEARKSESQHIETIEATVEVHLSSACASSFVKSLTFSLCTQSDDNYGRNKERK
jgi:hypothetical protein